MKQATHFSVQPGWKVLLSDMGINPAHVVSLAGLPADLLSRKHATLSPVEYFSLWNALEQIAGADELPLKLGQALSVEAFDPPIFACLCSPNLNTALQRLAEYKRLIGPLTMVVVVGKHKTRVTLACYDHAGEMPRSLGAMELVFFTQLARLATRRRIIPAELALPRLPESSKPYTTYFGAPIRPGQAIRIAFSAEDAVYPFLTENTTMWDFFEPGLKKRLSDLDTATDITQRVKSALLEMLPGGRSSIEEAAGRLAMSKRTLQRHLSRESSNFQEILSATRKELAQHYLSRSAISQGEIGYLLGFQDGNSFLRAFKGWTGTTPAAYRSERWTAACATSAPPARGNPNMVGFPR